MLLQSYEVLLNYIIIYNLSYEIPAKNHACLISANVLMKEIHPLGIVPYHIIMNALAYQADPTSVEPLKHTSKEVKSYFNSYKYLKSFT